MIPEQIERIKQEYTDKYVVVDANLPELARFQDVVGQVKTVNMSGRALVEFAEFHLNIGWHDIDLDYLKVVDKPLPQDKAKKPATKKPAAKPAAKKEAAPAGEKKLSPLEMARMQDAGAKAAPAKPAAKKKMSVAEMMAAARAETAGGAAPAAKKEAPAETPAPAAQDKPTKPAKVDRSKMSVAEMLAAARGETAGGAATAAEEAAPEPEAEPAPEPVAEEAPTEVASEDGVVKVDRSSMSVAEMIAYCREKDA